MTIRFEETTLDVTWGDNDARLVFREDRLFAVVARLGDLHRGLAGHWYVETVYGDQGVSVGETFGSLNEFAAAAGEK